MSSDPHATSRDAAAQDLPIVSECLESTKPVNLARYETLGFRGIGDFAPPGGPTVTTKWRDAR
jgi:hypothetical protein